MQKKSAAFLLGLTVVGIVGLIGFSVWYLGEIQEGARRRHQIEAAFKETWPIYYTVSGSAEKVFLTIATPNGSEQQYISLPYKSPIYKFKRGKLSYISAQIREGDGDATVSILMGEAGDWRDAIKKRDSCEGRGSIASVSYKVYPVDGLFRPSCALSPTPATGASEVSTTPTLTWSAVSGATSYSIYFGTTATPPLKTTITGTSYTPGTLTKNTTYYWKIVSKNGSGNATGCATWRFKTSL